MSRYYSDPSREDDKWSLPDLEIFYSKAGEWFYDHDSSERCEEDDENAMPNEAGFYYWFCLPGCMPDSEPYGPYRSEEEALEDAREMAGT